MKISTRWRRIWIAVTVICLCVGLSGSLRAAVLPDEDVRIVIADDSESTRHIAAGLQRKFPNALVVADHWAKISRKRKAIYIAVGPNALRATLEKITDGVVISVFTSSQAYRSITESASFSRSLAVTGIYAEPSPSDQMQLISGLYKKPVNVAVLVSDKTAYLQPLLTRAAAQKSIALSIEHVDADDKLNRALNRVEHVSAILAIPDSSIYNVENIRNILITAYRRDQSVVGFSTAFVKAGALATTYSDINDILAQLAELLEDYAASGNLPEPQFPKYFSVAVNDSVARSLNVVIDERVRRLSRKPIERQP
jgi:ABC-type uncharacterized transport system substrate-binding protein